MSLSVGDYTGQMWLTGFNEIGESLIGMNANELLALKVRP
jgi:replication factor A1